MLSAIRERSKGTVAWIIVILIIIPFALWGVDQFNSGERVQVAAKVNGQTITTNEVARSLDNVKRQYQEAFGDLYHSLVKESLLEQQVLDDLVQRVAVDQQLKKEGFAISDALLAQVIQGQDMFQQDGIFSLAQYETILRNNGLTKEKYEQLQRDFLLRNQLENMVLSSAFIGHNELENLAKLDSQEREVAYLTVGYQSYLQDVQVTDEQVETYYHAHPEAFLAEEAVSVDYLTLSVRALAEKHYPTAEEIEDFYQDNLAKLTQPEKRNVRHILIQADGENQEAKAKLEAILAEIKAGADFADLAKEHSDDSGSAVRGGELGFFQHGDMVAEFEQAAFALQQVGDLSPVIQSQFGYHLLQLVDVEAAHTPSLADSKQLIEDELKFEAAQKQYNEQVDMLRTLAFEQDDSLQPAAEALGLEVKTSQMVTRQGSDGIFASPKIVEAAFSNSVIEDKLNSPVVETQLGEAVVLRLNSYQAAQAKSLESVKPVIAGLLKKEMAIEKAKADAESWLKVLSENQKSADQFVRDGVIYHPPQWVSRSSDSLPADVVAATFKSVKPSSDGQQAWTQHLLENGDVVLLTVSAVRVDEAHVKSALSSTSDAAVQLFSDMEQEALVADIKNRAEIELKLK